MNNLLLIYKDNDTYFVKNNCNGSIVKLNQNYYEMLLNKKEEVIKKLFDNNFFIMLGEASHKNRLLCR